MSILLGGLLLLWLFLDFQRARKEKAALRRQRRCRLCFFEFTPSEENELAPCPKCGSPTPKGGVRHF